MYTLSAHTTLIPATLTQDGQKYHLKLKSWAFQEMWNYHTKMKYFLEEFTVLYVLYIYIVLLYQRMFYVNKLIGVGLKRALAPEMRAT